MAPMKDGQVVPPAEFNAWPAERQQEAQTAIEELEKDLEETLRVLPRLEREQRDAMRALDRDTARFVIAQPIEDCKAQFADLPKVVQHLEAIQADILENVALFIAPQAPGEEAPQRPAGAVRPLRGQRVRHDGGRRGRRPGDRGGASDAEQSGRPHRASRGAGRAGDQFPPDQAGQPASRQWRRADDRPAQPADRAAELGGAEARAAAAGDRDRGRRAVHGHDRDGDAGAGSDPARREGRAVRRPHAVLHAGAPIPTPRSTSRCLPTSTTTSTARRRAR